MSNRNLVHFFTQNTAKPAASSVDDVSGDTVSSSLVKRPRTGGSKTRSILLTEDDDDDFENDHILPPRYGNSITKYFSPVDKATASKKTSKPCKMTVEAQVHGSPTKHQCNRILLSKKTLKKKKRKTGIPSSLADTIELVSTEELITEPNLNQEPMEAPQPTVQKGANSTKPWKMKICLERNIKISDDDLEETNLKERPRRSVRLRVKPNIVREDGVEKIESRRNSLKKRKKSVVETVEKDEIQIISEDVAPIFLKKKWEEEARAVKKAKQEFLFSGVPEILKQQSAVQSALEQRSVEIFPKISHVTQAGSRPWKLGFPNELSTVLRNDFPSPKIEQPKAFSPNLNSYLVDSNLVCPRSVFQKQASYLEWCFCKEWINRLKGEHSLSFPFFRTLRMLLSKINKEDVVGEDLPWTDAYAPKQAVDILANNRKSVQLLKDWLNQWKMRAGEEATLSPRKTAKKIGKRKRISSEDSGSEEAAVDESSNKSWNPDEQLCSCVLLVGPAGCGKTASVYALAEELGYNVLEVNASSRRNGKTVLSHLHEATQSHSLNNNSSSTANTMNKLFFGAEKVAKPNRQEAKTSLTLLLFEDVDIVFESEDESFYSALTTLIQTSKRPIVLTLGSTEERILELVQDKIKSYFKVFPFVSPDISTACGYLWCLCLAEGYPLEWKTLEQWVKNRDALNLDLRSLVLQLQLLLQSHPLRLKLNFSQLQLKNDEGNPNFVKNWKVSHDCLDTNPVQLIKLPVIGELKVRPSASPLKFSRFAYDADRDMIIVSEDRNKKRFSRIVPNNSSDESDLPEESNTIDGLQHTQSEKWRGDLVHLAHCLDLRAGKDLLTSCSTNNHLSWNGASLMFDVQEFITSRCTKLMEEDFGQISYFSEDHSLEIRNGLSTKNANHMLLRSSVSRTMLLQHQSHSVDVLPYLRSFLRLDLERCVSKRRRKQRIRLESPTTRLPTLDLVMATSSAVQLANNF